MSFSIKKVSRNILTTTTATTNSNNNNNNNNGSTTTTITKKYKSVGNNNRMVKFEHDLVWTQNKGMLPLSHYRNTDPDKFSGWLHTPLSSTSISPPPLINNNDDISFMQEDKEWKVKRPLDPFFHLCPIYVRR